MILISDIIQVFRKNNYGNFLGFSFLSEMKNRSSNRLLIAETKSFDLWREKV